jgi:flagellar basal body-associated protein FliL
MRKLVVFILVVLSVHLPAAQQVRVVVPADAVVSGNAFQVQYIITDPGNIRDIESPDFDSLRVVSGPHHYKGNIEENGKVQPIENITFTLLASHEGKFQLSPLKVLLDNGSSILSDEATIRVIPPFKASFTTHSSFTDAALYAPADKADLDQLIKENLFIKTTALPLTCYQGEPVTVVFKLYSRLQSTSEVINSPSLYGFSVMDILDINRAYPAVETIGDKIFNTAVLRKLQLYPGQSGKLVIDEMELQNEIEFDDPNNRGKKIRIKKEISSAPVTIQVKPLPEPRPAEFNGAVGRFQIHDRLLSSHFRAGEQGKLILSLSGRGNFIQLAAPQVLWPEGINAFDPLTEDSIDKNAIPAEGSRQYSFSFTSDSAGNYTIPPVVFSFFDPAERSYKKVRTDALSFQVMPAGTSTDASNSVYPAHGKRFVWTMIGFVVVLLAGGSVFVFYHGKSTVEQPETSKENFSQKLAAIPFHALDERQACAALERVLALVSLRYSLMTEAQREELSAIRQECQVLAYSDIRTEGKKEELKKRAVALLRQIES